MGNNLTIVEALLLIESLDSSHKSEPLGAIEYNDYHKQHGITEHKAYKLDGGHAGIMHIWKRHNAYEIHHGLGTLEHNVSGEWVPSGKHNEKFAGTMYKVTKNILTSGNRVRIVGNHTNGMFDHYNRMANILAKRDGYSVSTPTRYSLDSPKSVDYSEITISKEPKNSALSEMNIAVTLNNSENNNYGKSDYHQSFDSIDSMMSDYFSCNK